MSKKILSLLMGSMINIKAAPIQPIFGQPVKTDPNQVVKLKLSQFVDFYIPHDTKERILTAINTQYPDLAKYLDDKSSDVFINCYHFSEKFKTDADNDGDLFPVLLYVVLEYIKDNPTKFDRLYKEGFRAVQNELINFMESKYSDQDIRDGFFQKYHSDSLIQKFKTLKYLRETKQKNIYNMMRQLLWNNHTIRDDLNQFIKEILANNENPFCCAINADIGISVDYTKESFTLEQITDQTQLSSIREDFRWKSIRRHIEMIRSIPELLLSDITLYQTIYQSLEEVKYKAFLLILYTVMLYDQDIDNPANLDEIFQKVFLKEITVEKYFGEDKINEVNDIIKAVKKVGVEALVAPVASVQATPVVMVEAQSASAAPVHKAAKWHLKQILVIIASLCLLVLLIYILYNQMIISALF